MWKLKDENKADNALKMKSSLLALKGKISEIKDIEVGINTLESPTACDIVLTVTTADKDALDRYIKHPEHQKLVEFILSVIKDRYVVDYEI